MLPSHSSAGSSPGAFPPRLTLNSRLLASQWGQPLPQPWAAAVDCLRPAAMVFSRHTVSLLGTLSAMAGAALRGPAQPTPGCPGKEGPRGMRAGLGPGPGRRPGHGAEGGAQPLRAEATLAGRAHIKLFVRFRINLFKEHEYYFFFFFNAAIVTAAAIPTVAAPASSLNMITEHVLGPSGIKTHVLQAGFIAMDAMC